VSLPDISNDFKDAFDAFNKLARDIREAIAFFIFIHCYPFLSNLNNDEIERLGKIFNLFKYELGDYYRVIREHPEYQAVFVEPEPVGKESSEELIIKSEDDIKDLIINTVREYGKIHYSELASLLTQKVLNGEIVVDPKKANTSWGKKLMSGNEHAIRQFFIIFCERMKIRGLLYEPEFGYFSVLT
jgi:hypothetical protein